MWPVEEVGGRRNVFLDGVISWTILLSIAQCLTLGPSLLKIHLSQVRAVAVIIFGLGCAAGYLLVARRREGLDPSRVHPRAGKSLFFRVVLIIAYLGLLGLSSASKISSWDSHVYHIPTVVLWLQEGYVHWILPAFECSPYMNGYPKGVEVVGFLVASASGIPAMLQSANLLFLPLGVLGIASIMRSLGGGLRASMWTGYGLLLVPLVPVQMLSLDVDASFAFCVIAMLAVFVALIKEFHETGQCPLRLTWAAGLTAGLVLALKATGIAIAGVSTGILFICIWKQRATRARIPVIGAISIPVMIVAIAFVVGGYWYVRNMLMQGSPVYPVGFHVAGKVVFPGYSIQQVVPEAVSTPSVLRGQSGLVKVVAVWLWDVLRWPSVNTRYGGLGVLWACGCIPATCCIAFQILRRQGRSRLIGFLLLSTLIAFLFTPVRWVGRFVIWVYALGLPCLGLVLERHFAQPVRAKWIDVWAVGVILLSCAQSGILAAQSLRSQWEELEYNQTLNVVLPGSSRTQMENLISDHISIAVTPFRHERPYIWALLNYPLALRKICPVSEILDENDWGRIRSSDARLLIWDRSFPVPESLQARSSVGYELGNLRVFELNPECDNDP